MIGEEEFTGQYDPALQEVGLIEPRGQNELDGHEIGVEVLIGQYFDAGHTVG